MNLRKRLRYIADCVNSLHLNKQFILNVKKLPKRSEYDETLYSINYNKKIFKDKYNCFKLDSPITCDGTTSDLVKKVIEEFEKSEVMHYCYNGYRIDNISDWYILYKMLCRYKFIKLFCLFILCFAPIIVDLKITILMLLLGSILYLSTNSRVYDCNGEWIDVKTGETSLCNGEFNLRLKHISNIYELIKYIERK